MFRLGRFLLVIHFLYLPFLYGQDYTINTIDVNLNGESALTYKSIFMDSEGFLWYSSFNAVVRIMGSEHILYPIRPDGEDPLNYVIDFIEAKDHQLIIITTMGVVNLDVLSGDYQWILPMESRRGERLLFNSGVFDDEGNLWLGTNFNDMYCYTKDGKVEIYTSDIKGTSVLNMGFKNLVMMNHEYIVFNHEDSVYKFNTKTKQFSLLKGKLNEALNPDIDFYYSENGSLFPRDSSGFYVFEGKQYAFDFIAETKKQFYQFPYIVHKLLKNSSGDYFILSANNNNLNVYRLIQDKGSLELRLQKRIPLGTDIMRITLDDHNTIYSITKHGISIVQFYEEDFISHLNENIKNPVSARGMCKDEKGDIYLFTQSGFYKKRNGKDKFEGITFYEENNVNKSIPIVSLYDICMGQNQTIWAYGFSDYIYHINLKTGLYKSYVLPNFLIKGPLFISVNNINQIEKDIYMISTSKGLAEFNGITKQFKDRSYLNDSIPKLNKVLFTYKDRSQNYLWIGTGKGLFRKDRTTGSVVDFSREKGARHIPANRVKVVHEDVDGLIWLGTNHGLYNIDPGSLENKTFTKHDGLKDDHIVGIIEVGDYLWLSTFNGLVRYSKSTGMFEDYFEVDGLPDNEFNTTSYYKESDSSLYFGGINGVVQFDPAKIESKIKNPQILLIDVERYIDTLKTNQTYRLKNTATTPVLNIPHDRNYINLRFAVNDITNTENNTYLYRIKELREDWINLGSFNKVQLQGLEPNTYTLEVKGFDSAGTPTNVLSYTINIKQIFYKTNLFKALFIIFLTSILFIYAYYRRDALLKNIERKHKFAQLEAKALRAQMNPHFIFNSLNGIQSVMILKGEKEANTYMAAFSKLLRLTLEMSSSEYITLKNEVEYLKSYLQLEKIRMNDNLEYDFTLPEKACLEETAIPCMMLQPIVENAIIHGLSSKAGEKKVVITLKTIDGYLIAHVEDNGIGRKAAELKKDQSMSGHRSMATKIMNDRMDITNDLNEKKMSIQIIDLFDNATATGTKVELKIPLTYLN